MIHFHFRNCFEETFKVDDASPKVVWYKFQGCGHLVKQSNPILVTPFNNVFKNCKSFHKCYILNNFAEFLSVNISFFLQACFLTFLAMANAFPQKVWPAGVSPAACPNYPDCDNTIDPTLGVARNAPTPNVPSLQFPAGVSAAACPDFPFCTQR